MRGFLAGIFTLSVVAIILAAAGTAGSAPPSKVTPKPNSALGQSSKGFQHVRSAHAGHGLDRARHGEPQWVIDARNASGREEPRRDTGPRKPVVSPRVGSTESGSGTLSASASGPSAPILGGDFLGNTYQSSFPPDPSLAVGPHHVIALTNDGVSVYKKTGPTGGKPLLRQPLGTFFNATDQIFDPVGLYDEYTQRYFLIAVSLNPKPPSDTDPKRSTLHVAVSDDENPENSSSWSVFNLDVRNNGGETSEQWCDYPKIGVNALFVFFTCNMYDFADDNEFQYSKIRVMTKSQFTGGTCCSYWDVWNMFDVFRHAQTIQPAYMYGAASNENEILVNAHGQGGDDNDLSVWQIHNAGACCGGSGDPELEGVNYEVGDFSDPPDAGQLNSSTPLNTGSTRLLFAFWRNGNIAMGQNTACHDDVDVCSSYTEIRTSDGFDSITTAQDFVVGTPGENFFYPSTNVNDAGNRTMVFTRSSPSMYAGAYYVGIPAGAPRCVPDSCPSPPIDGPATELEKGANSYVLTDTANPPRNRWGDYLGSAQDPDGVGIWIHGEFASATANQWSTQVGLTYESMDTTPPVTSAETIPPPNAAGWNRDLGILAKLTSTDTGSGPRFITYSASGAQTIAQRQVAGDRDVFVGIQNEGITTISFFGEDNWGNVESPAKTHVVRIDRTAPSINCDPPDGAWHGANAAITCRASDSLSGLADPTENVFELHTNVPEGTETDNATTNTRSICDAAGNCATAGPISGIKIDRKPPAISITVPSGLPTYLLRQSVAADYSCSDGSSGVATCTGPVADGSPIDTSWVGVKTFTVSATDQVGNAASASENYLVTFKICLAYDANKPFPKGSVVEIRIKLCDVNNLNVSSPDIVVQATRVSSPGTLQNPGNTNPGGVFQYLTTGGYLYNLGTKSYPAGSYKLFFTATGDPIEHEAPFRLK